MADVLNTERVRASMRYFQRIIALFEDVLVAAEYRPNSTHFASNNAAFQTKYPNLYL